MSRYQSLSHRIQHDKKPVYLPYVMLGYPTQNATLEACKVLIEAGVHGLELGLPFRDPMADGPVIQAAANMALDNGFTTAQAAELVAQIRGLSPTIPFTLMTYYNMVVAQGVEAFVTMFAKAGVDGILIPDLPPEYAEEVAPIFEKHGLKMVLIASPLSDDSRLELIGRYAGGFVYVITRLGITGVDETYSQKLPDLFARIHKHINLPAIAGFGISKPEHMDAMAEAGADGVIVGSKLVQLIGEAHATDNFAPVTRHAREMVMRTETLRQNS
jgi:tryptophan synthase alpha chain